MGKAKEIQRVYEECLTQHIKKRVSWVISVFKKIYDDNIKSQNFKKAMDNYQKHLEQEKSDLIKDFAKKVTDAVTQMIESYRCNYKCYFRTGCYGFSRRSFRRSCVRMPCAPRYSYKLVGLCAFNPEWKAPPCPVPTTPKIKPAVVETFNHQKYLDDIDNTAAIQGNELKLKSALWRKEVDDWKVQTLKTLMARIETMMPKATYCKQAWTMNEIEEFRKGLRAQATNWVNQQVLRLYAQITKVYNMWSQRIESWRVQARAFIMRIKSRLESSARHHKCLFDRFFTCSFGKAPISTDTEITKLKKEYHDCIDLKVSRVIQLFNQYWVMNKTKYIQHYECGFKCTPKVTVPTFRACYQWRFCAPSLSCFRFYCY